jgi:hypothetical protein
MDNFLIKYHKWNKDDSKHLHNSCKEVLSLKFSQFYNPIYSLYFYYHNTKKSKHKLDLKRKYYLKRIISSDTNKYYNSNKIINCFVFNSHTQSLQEIKAFAKCIPILDPQHFIMNNYTKNYTMLPSNYSYNTHQKLNAFDNSAYIDAFFSYIVGEIDTMKLSPTFPAYYGSLNGISDSYKYDITDEFYDFYNETWFKKNMNRKFKINQYMADTDSDSDEEDDYICNLFDVPCQYLFIEKLEGTMEDLFTQDMKPLLIISGLFQIIFAIGFLQKHFDFTHNDLHINNIMFKETKKKFLYYKWNNQYYRIPTYGKLFKIIDFGRAIFTFRNKLFFNDVFSKYGEAEGQYTYPNPNIPNYTNHTHSEIILPNQSFDMCRLNTTIMDVLKNLDNYSDLLNNEKIQEIVQFCSDSFKNKQGESIYNDEDSFELYMRIAKEACRSKPHDLLQHSIFKRFRIKKKEFPKKNYYKMN